MIKCKRIAVDYVQHLKSDGYKEIDHAFGNNVWSWFLKHEGSKNYIRVEIDLLQGILKAWKNNREIKSEQIYE